MTDRGGRLRARFLAAMGVPAAAGLVAACGSASPGPHPVVVSSTEDMYRNPIQGVTGAWTVGLKNEPESDLPSCTNGTFCVVGARDDSEGTAAAPFESCAGQVPYPGPRPDFAQHRQTSFSETWTARERKATDPNACCYHWVEPCPGGRPLRDEQARAVVARIAIGDVESNDDAMVRDVARHAGWARPLACVRTDEARARMWEQTALLEHASIASFARFSLELLALGAPVSLVARAHGAALEEITHAELAFGLATSFDGHARRPGPLPAAATPICASPAAVLLSTIRDGCIAETVASLDARDRIATACTKDERDVLSRIAVDEEGHAELAFMAVAWIVSTYGDAVSPSLEAEIARIEREGGCDVTRAVVLPCLRALTDFRSVDSAVAATTYV